MELRGEEKADAHLQDAPGHLLRGEGEIDPQGLDNVGGAAAEETARLPCLATLSPAPATTKAVVVETLKVEVASPPVPQVSTTVSRSTLISSRSRSIRPSEMGMRVALVRITRAAAVISATVSPFMRSAVMKEPIWASVASPFIIISMARVIAASFKSCPWTTW